MKEKMGNVNKKKCQEIKLYIQGLDGLNYETEWYIIFQKGILLFFWIKRKKKKEKRILLVTFLPQKKELNIFILVFQKKEKEKIGMCGD